MTTAKTTKVRILKALLPESLARMRKRIQDSIRKNNADGISANKFMQAMDKL